jgi:hypothetical protein
MAGWGDAVGTLRRVADALAADWAGLDPTTRDAVSGLVRTYGPQIALANQFSVGTRATALLDGLWPLRGRLPAAAAQTLQAAAVAANAPGYRGVPVVNAADQAALRDALARIVDFRVFREPEPLAVQVSALVTAHQDRLTPDELTAWQALEAAYLHSQTAAAAPATGGVTAGIAAADAGAEAYLRGVEALLAGYPQVYALLQSAKDWAPAPARVMRGMAMQPGHGPGMAMTSPLTRAEPPSPGEGAAPEAAVVPAAPAAEAEPPALSRYANVYFPATVLLTQRQVPLIVHLAQAAQAASVVSADAGKVTVQTGDVTIVLRAEGFDLEQAIGGRAVDGAPAARTVMAAPGQDSEPVVFFLNPQSVGRKHISLEMYQADRSVGVLGFETEVADQVAVAQLANVAVAPVAVTAPAAGAQPPDLELRVMLSADHATLMYYLHSPGGADYNFQPFGQVTLASEPRLYLQPKLDELSTLASSLQKDRDAATTQATLQELADLGHNLYDDLFPQELKDEYAAALRDKYRGKSVLITSDDPWIPWEVVTPFASDRNGKVLYDDPPLCEMFQVSRWLAGRGAPDTVSMKNGVWIAPPDNLAAAQAESDYFSDLYRRQWGVILAGPLGTLADVQTKFREGKTELFHFACHGNFDTGDPKESKLKLADDYLRPSQISGQLQAGLRRARPLVFLNACHSGQTGYALTQLGGWVNQFLDAGASAFIGSLWEINDQLAAQFAEEFYNRLWGLAGFEKMLLGRAFYEARMAIKKTDPANPTWLAYVLYGDPLGSVTLG